MRITQTYNDEYLKSCKSISLEARFEFLDNFAKLNIQHYIPEYEIKQQGFCATIKSLSGS